MSYSTSEHQVKDVEACPGTSLHCQSTSTGFGKLSRVRSKNVHTTMYPTNMDKLSVQLALIKQPHQNADIKQWPSSVQQQDAGHKFFFFNNIGTRGACHSSPWSVPSGNELCSAAATETQVHTQMKATLLRQHTENMCSLRRSNSLQSVLIGCCPLAALSLWGG